MVGFEPEKRTTSQLGFTVDDPTAMRAIEILPELLPKLGRIETEPERRTGIAFLNDIVEKTVKTEQLLNPSELDQPFTVSRGLRPVSQTIDTAPPHPEMLHVTRRLLDVHKSILRERNASEAHLNGLRALVTSVLDANRFLCDVISNQDLNRSFLRPMPSNLEEKQGSPQVLPTDSIKSFLSSIDESVQGPVIGAAALYRVKDLFTKLQSEFGAATVEEGLNVVRARRLPAEYVLEKIRELAISSYDFLRQAVREGYPEFGSEIDEASIRMSRSIAKTLGGEVALPVAPEIAPPVVPPVARRVAPRFF